MCQGKHSAVLAVNAIVYAWVSHNCHIIRIANVEQS